MEPIRLEIFLDDKTAAGIGSASKGMENMEQVGTQALKALQAQMDALRAKIEQFNTTPVDISAERAQLEELKKSYATLSQELEKLRKAKVKNNQTQVMEDDPAPKINNLKMSITQVARELPSLTMGPQMFFLAISNNIPMVQDALAQARKEHDALVTSGKKATPVWRQVVSSLLSWQTGLAVGITLLVMYGKEIWDFTKSLFGVKEAAVEAMRSSDEFRESVVGSSSDVIAKLMELSAEYTALGQNIDAQNQFIANNQNRFDELGLSISNVQEAENALIGNTDKVIQAMLARAQAAAASETMQEELKKAMELRQEWEETDEKMTYTTYSGLPFQGGKWVTITTDNPEKDKARKAYDDQMARIRELVKFQQDQKELADGILGSIGLGGSDKNDPEAGSIAGLDAEIRLKRQLQQATKTKEEYQKIQKEIDALEEKKIAITGSSRRETKGQQKEYDPTEDRLKLMRENQQKEIDLMTEGNEKKRAQLALDYQKRLDDIKELEKKLSDASGGKLNDNDLEQIRKAYGMADNEYLQGMAAIDQEEQDEKQKHLDELLKKYQDYEARRKALQEQTDKDIRDLQEKRNTDNADAIDAAMEEARKQLRKGLEAINSEEASQASKDSPFLRNLFGDYSEMAYQDLKNLIAQARQLQDYLNGTGSKEGITFIAPDQLAAIEQSPDDLDRLRKALKQLLQEGEKGDKWTQLLQRFKKGLEDLKNADDYKDYASGISEISAVAGEAAGALAEMAENMGAAGAAQALSTLETAMSSISAIGEGFAKGGILGGVMATIGETAKLIAKGAAEERKHQEALEALMEQRLAQQRAYNLLLMEQNLEYEKADTVFGSDPYGKAVNSLKVYKQAISDFKKELQGDGKSDSVSWWERILAPYYSGLREQIAYKDQYAGLADVQIKTGSYTTGAWFWKKQHDEFGSVLDEYPELLDAQGNFNKELAQTILDTREMSDESRAALENFINLAEKQEEALSVMKDYLTDIFGELGGTLSDALTDAFRNGSDAAQEFEKSVVSMLEGLAQQMAYSVTLAPLFEQASEKMLEVMKTEGLTPEEQFKQYTDIIANTMDKGLAAQDDFNRLLEAAKQAAAEKGLDLFLPDQDSSGSSQSASVGGYAALTQEQGTKLEGLFTGVYDRMVSIHSLMVSLQKDRQADSRLLAQIAENTAYCRYLLSIYEMMERMDREGITVR